MKQVPFKSFGAVSYLPSILYSNYGEILHHLQDIYSELLVENREIFIPHLYLAPVGISQRCLILELLRYRVEKNCNNILSRLRRIAERNGRRKDKIAISISRVSMLTEARRKLQNFL